MEGAAASWADELTKARTDINTVRRNLSDLMGSISQQQPTTTTRDGGVGAGDPIPNPVQLIDRIAKLESELKVMEGDCDNICTRRSILAKQTADALLRNVELISELSERVGGGSDIGIGGINNNDDDNAGGIAGVDPSWRESVDELTKQSDMIVTAKDAAAD